jgi:hypothetical protein
MKKFLNKYIPLWLVIVIFFVILIIAFFIYFYFNKTVYNYSFKVSSLNNSSTQYIYGAWPVLQNKIFYDEVLYNFISQKSTFITVDLSSMDLKYYKDGSLAFEVPVLSKGKPGSWWDTPVGLYKVKAKIPSDFSSFAHVYSPWALDFQGNFLIHGWPYYPDGTPVPSTYSGGCIRLSTPNAKTLYNMVDVGIPVLVFDNNFNNDNFIEQNFPNVSAESFIAGDLRNNYIFTEKNPDEQLPIASLTKLMTALVAVEYINIENTITITPDMIVKTSIPRLKVGHKYSLYDLLQPLLKESSNEAAVAISRFIGTDYFVKLMNEQASAIGMTNTHFVDPSGSDWGDVSTARDYFEFAKYLYLNRSFILKMTTNSNDVNVYGPSVFTNLQNFNVFAGQSDFVGGKVGVNGGAHDTIVSVFNEEFPIINLSVASGSVAMGGVSNGYSGSTSSYEIYSTSTASSSVTQSFVLRQIAFVILGSSNYTNDAETLLNWIKNVYQ